MRWLVRVLLPFILACALVFALSRMPFSWSGWQSEYCGLQNCYCEPFAVGVFVRQPLTAASNLSYILAGLIVFASKPARSPLSRIGFGSALVAAGLCSFLSHASLTRAGEWLDLMGVYGILTVILVINLCRVFSSKPVYWLHVAILVAGGIQMLIWPQFQQLVVAALAGGGAALEAASRRKPQPGRHWLLAAAALLLSGALIWAWYGRAPVCSPESGWPWHTAWHALSAAGLGCYYASLCRAVQ